MRHIWRALKWCVLLMNGQIKLNGQHEPPDPTDHNIYTDITG